MLQIKSVPLTIVMTLCFNPLSAAAYDSDILNTYSKLSPRFILMSTQKSKIDERINICLSHEPEDEAAAQELIDLTRANYPKGIKEYEIHFVKTRYGDARACSESQLHFLFNTNRESLKNALLFSQTQKIMTISYDGKHLEDGVDISLFIGRKIVPHLNIKSIEKKGIQLDNLLLRISKIYNINTKADK